MSIRTESKAGKALSPFYVAAGVALVALAVIAFLVLTR